MTADGLDAIVAYSNAKVQGCVQYLANYAVRFVAANTLPDGSYTMAGSCAALFPRDGDDTVLLADQRWDELRAREVSALAETRFSGELGAELGRLIAERGYRTVGIDNWFVFPAHHYLALREHAPDVDFVPTFAIEHTYKVKSPAELALIRRAEDVGVQALEAAFEAVHVGATEHEIALAADYAMRTHGDLELAGGMVAAAGPNTAIASGLPSAEDSYVLERGDWIMLDICPRYQGYAGDICRMFVAGDLDDVDPFRQRLYAATVAIVEEVVRAVRAGRRSAGAERARPVGRGRPRRRRVQDDDARPRRRHRPARHPRLSLGSVAARAGDVHHHRAVPDRARQDRHPRRGARRRHRLRLRGPLRRLADRASRLGLGPTRSHVPDRPRTGKEDDARHEHERQTPGRFSRTMPRVDRRRRLPGHRRLVRRPGQEGRVPRL